MNRLPHGYANEIGTALDILPDGIRQRLNRVEFLCGVHPVYAGLIENGGWYDEHPHIPGRPVSGACCYPWNTRDHSLTVVLIEPHWWNGVMHELGHALQMVEHLWQWQATPVTDYARHNSREAFAEAFVAWFGLYDQDAFMSDLATRDLFWRLATPR